MDKELEEAIVSNRYQYYEKNRINHSDSADRIMEKIKNGYDPNEADVFELMNDSEEKIKLYRRFYEIRDKVGKERRISKEDFDFLISILGVDSEWADYLQKGFEYKEMVK